MKNQLKKNLSLLMAVLMILSCWVWVAPDKAEAAQSTYEVKIDFSVSNMVNGGTVYANIGYIPKNGTGIEDFIRFELNDVESKEGDYTVSLPDIDGWPSQVQIRAYDNGMTTFEFVVKSIWVNNRKVVEGTWTYDGGWYADVQRQFVPNTQSAATADGKSGKVSGKTEGTWDWPRPTLDRIEKIEAENVTLNKLGGQSVASNITLSQGVDSYDVDWKNAIPSTGVDFRVYYTDAEGKEYDIDSQYAPITTANGIKVNLKPEIQTLFPDTNEFDSDGNSKFSGKGTIHVDATYNNKAVGSGANIEMTFPTYTASFYPNGGTIGTSAINNTSDDNNPIVIGGEEEEKHNLYYGSIIGSPPAYAQKAGMTFAGYYNYKNPDLTGRKSAEDHFVGVKFNKDNKYTTVDHNGDSNWYAAWEASKINASFMVGDQLLGTVEGRYNNSMLGKGGDMYGTEAQLNDELYSAYKKDAIKFDSDKNPVLYINGQKNVFAGWQIIDCAYDESLIYNGDLSTVLYGDVTFGAKFIPASDATESKYTVIFYNGNVNNGQPSEMSRNTYSYRALVSLPGSAPRKAQDQKYTYEFAGWAEYIGTPFYAVDENSEDINGSYIHYTPKETAEFIATKNVAYVPVFKMIPREYKVTFITLGDNGIQAGNVVVPGYHFGDSITVPEEIKDNYTQAGRRYFINGWKTAGSSTVNDIADITVNGDMTLTASYDKEGILAEYTIRFFDMYGNLIGAEYDEDGNLLNGNDYIHQHNTTVTAPTVGNVEEGDDTTYYIPYTIDTEDALYTFKGWTPAVNTTASADVDYKAEYTSKEYADVYFYNYDGTLLYKLDGKENANFVEDTIPVYSQALPEREEDVTGTYTFTGWANSDGEAVIPGTNKFTGDTHLIAQYAKTDKQYTVLFLNGDEVVSRQTLKYGESVEIPANPTKEADDLYEYSFRAWDVPVSEICYGNATYNATFRRSAIYHDIYWLAENKKDEIRHSKYAFGARIQAATAPAEGTLNGVAPDGYTWGFKEWVRCDEFGRPLDKDGNIVEEAAALKFERGMTMPKETLYFYPAYELAATMLEVEFYDEYGTTLIGKTKIPYNAEIDDYAGTFVDEAVKPSTDTYHFEFSKWVKLDDSELPTNSDNNYIVTEAVKVKASYTAGSHNFVVVETILAPTCTETGIVKMACKSEYCDQPSNEEIIAVIPDDNAPTAQVYMGSRKWTMNEYTSDAGIDYTEKVYVGANSATIVNAEDVGTWSMPWNTDIFPVSRGVGKIDYAIVDVTGKQADEIKSFNPQEDVSVWTNLYNYSEVEAEVLAGVLADRDISETEYEDLFFENQAKKLEIDNEVKAILSTYKANATGILGELGLENGKDYVIYLRFSDREVLTLPGDINYSYMSTGRLHYGTEAAAITVTGNGYGTKFCEKANIRIMDDTDGFEIYIDGVKQDVSATTTSVTGASSVTFTNEEIGVHTITVIDKNGNKATKTFEIKGGHTYRNYTIAANCENDGSRYDLCSVCGVKANEEVLAKLGHSYKSYTETAPTCVDDGTRVYVCDNNCGEKLVVGPASAEQELAKAQVYDETISGWRTLTASDLKHLDATGEHTYAKVVDEEGKETAEDAWVIDKAATCSADGEKHKDCTKCGYRETKVIPADTENGHKFYRPRVEKGDEPTCTEKGIRSETCRYCSFKRTFEEIDALGHTAGEYKLITEATCDAAGSKILTCSVCKDSEGNPIEIGEPIEDAQGKVTGFDGKAVSIPALGHNMKAEGEPYQKTPAEGAEPDNNWYQKYVCDNGCGHWEEKITEHEEQIKATVTFKNGEADVQTVEKIVGETIIATAVTVPTKAADATYKYTFSHWATRTGAGTEADPYVYTAVEFPITVAEGGATYYAVFAEKNIKYTVTYLNEDGTQYKKVGYLNNGTVVELEEGPAKADTVYKTFEFAGWAMDVEVENDDALVTDGNVGATVIKRQVVENNEVTINGANVVLYATYTSKDRSYAVTYANTMTDTIESFLVQAGTKARACAIIPEKEADSKYHYTFTSWNRANQLEAVTSNIYTTPNFASVTHDLKVVVVSAATCTANQVAKKVCDCGYETAAAEVKNTMLGHNWSTETKEVDGKIVRWCQNDGCNATTADTRTFTFNFYYEEPADENVRPNRDVSNIAWGTKVDASRLPANPEKDADDQYIYTFKGWKIKGEADDKIQKLEELVVKQDYDFVAVYDKAVREYKVTFAYEYSHKPIKTYTVKYGLGVTFDGDTPSKENDTDPNYDPENYHYTFKGWSAETTKITKETIVYAKFEKAEHTYGPAIEISNATCQQGTGYKYVCTVDSCKHEKLETGKPLPHEMEIVESKPATPEKDGYIKKQCKNCDYVETETVKYEDTTIKVIVTVDRDGAPAASIKVITQALGEDATKDASTNVNGVATIVVEKNKTYVAWVEIDGEKIPVSLVTDASGNFIGVYSIVTNNNNNNDSDCGCACHRNNFWGTIFRFFHKIIKLFTGEFKCCGNPDPMYG